MANLFRVLLAVLFVCWGYAFAAELDSVFSSYSDAVKQFVNKPQDAVWLQTWLHANESEVLSFLENIEDKNCDEAIVLQTPAMHAGELAVMVGCRKGDQIWLRQKLPSKNHLGNSQSLDVRRWDAFMSEVGEWKPMPKRRSELLVPRGWDRPSYVWAQGYIALLGIYQNNSWKLLPLRGTELVGVPQPELRIKRSRWQMAMDELLGIDVNRRAAEEEPVRKKLLATGEHDLLWKYIRDDERANFNRALTRLKYLKRDSAEMYSLVFWAVENGRDQMAARIINSGTPLKRGVVAHPALISALINVDPCGTCELSDQQARARRAINVFMPIVRSARPNGLESKSTLDNFHAELEHLTAKRLKEKYLEANRDTQSEDFSQKIDADPRLAFAQSFGSRALHVAIQGNHVPATKRDSRGQNLLFYALQEEKHAELATQLIEQDIDIETPNDYGVTPLMLASGNSTAGVLKRMLAAGTNVNVRNADGATALMYAALSGREENVRLLLAAGAVPGLKDAKGNTAQEMAKWQGFAGIVRMLDIADTSRKEAR